MPEGGLDFETWYAGTSARRAKQLAAEQEAADAAAADKAARASKDAVAFKGWDAEVTLHDRALEYITQLNGSHFSDEEAWKATGVCLAYIELAIAEAHKAAGSEPANNPARSMENAFTQGSRKNHSFDAVTISANLAKRFSKGARAGFESDGDNSVITGLSYTFLSRGPDGTKPLSTDDKLKNGVFSSMVKKAWARAVAEAQAQLDSDGGTYGSPEANAKRARLALARGLHTLIKKVQDDKDAAAKKAEDDAVSKREQGRSGHARWLELKDHMRIKLPPAEEDNWREPPYTRMDCMAPKGQSFRKAVSYKPILQTGADMARSMGVALKTGYAHALSGNIADLERSRKKLIEDGFVYLENFADPETGEITEESREKYREAVKMVAERKAAKEAAKRAKDAAAFGAWVETKEGAELALECMSIMPVVLTFDDPAQVASVEDNRGGAVGAGVDARSVTSGKDAAKEGVEKPLLGRPPTEDEYELWRAVGYACKAVDRALLPDWMRWSAPLFSRQDCVNEWSSFKPADYEKDSAAWKAKQEEEARKEREVKAKEDRELGIKPRPKAEVVRPPGGAVDLSHLAKFKVEAPESWTAEDRKRALKLLHLLSLEHRKIHVFRETAKNERAPALPYFRRKQTEEALPVFLHGHEGAVLRIQKDLAMAEGKGLPMLGGSGVGAELVLSWFVGEDDLDQGPLLGAKAIAASRAASRAASVAPPMDDRDMADFEQDYNASAEGKAMDGPGGAGGGGAGKASGGVEDAAKLMSRLRSAADSGAAPKAVSGGRAKYGVDEDGEEEEGYEGPYQPPYVIVVETCGLAGGKKQRDGEWTRVLIDPPEAMPILTATPGSTYVPLSAKHQGLGVAPPLPGKKWRRDVEKNQQKLRGAVRLTGLLPNTSYAFRIRAYSRAGASPYAFGVFTTAAPPPPSPIIALPSLLPRHLLPVSASGNSGEPGASVSLELSAAPCDIDAVTLCWERRIDLRTGLLRLLRLFYFCAIAKWHSERQARQAGHTGRRAGFTSGSSSQDGGSVNGYEDDTGVEEEGGAGGHGHGSGAGAMPVPGRGAPLPGSDGDLPGQLFTSARVPRTALLAAVQLEVGMRNWLASCVATVDHWPKAENAVMPPEFADGASNFRKLPARFKIALTRPCSVLEALVRDSRGSLSWDDITSMFEADGEADDPFDLMLAGTQLGGALGLGDETGKGAAGLDKEPRPMFSLSAGGKSVLSVQRSQLRKSMTISRTDAIAARERARPMSASGALGGSSGNTSLALSVPRGLPPSGAAGGTLRPSTAGGGGDITQQLALMRTKRRGSLASSSSSASSSAQKALAASLQLNKASGDVSLKYSLLQCISDGPRGQEWQEVFVGIRSLRRIDKLLPGTSYCFKVQSVNQDGQGSLFGPPAVITTALPPPHGLRVQGRVGATTVALQWDEVSSANALTTMRAMGGGGSKAKKDKEGDREEGSGKGPSSPSKGADIDAVLQALLAKGKEKREKERLERDGGGKEGDEDIFSSALSAIAIREGDGGVGVDLLRVWSRYDTDASGVIPVQCLRGVLADLGAYSETAALVNAAINKELSMHVASGEGAASAGPGEWRLQAALSVLDPKGTGSVLFSEFVDWWNAVDAAMAKAKGVSLKDQLEMKERAAKREAPTADGRRASVSSIATNATLAAQVGAMGALRGGLHDVLGDSVTVGDLSFAIVYVVEARRLLTKTEAASVAAGGPMPSALKAATPADGSGSGASAEAGGAGAHGGHGHGAGAGVVEEELSGADVLDATGRTAGSGNGRPASAGGVGGRPGSAAGGGGGVGGVGGMSSPASPGRAGATLASPTPDDVRRAPLYTHWAVVYMGPSNAHRLHGLLPNGEYEFRVSALGRHAYSSPSKTITVNMPPLAPFAPVLIKTDPRAVKVRWYPGELGADKFEVQIKLVDTLKKESAAVGPDGKVDDTARLKIAAGTALVGFTPTGMIYKGRNVSEAVTRRLATSRHFAHSTVHGAGGAGYGDGVEHGEAELWQEHPEETWATLYTGTSTFAALTGLYASSVYHMRVVAYNAAGVPSRPSPETQVVTGGNAALESITVANASRLFVVECVPSPVSYPGSPWLAGRSPIALQDVVVGDVILFTEDVFIDSGPEPDPYHPAGPREVHESSPRAQFFCSRTIAAQVIGDSASLVNAAQGHSANIANPGGPVPVGATATAFAVSGYLTGMQTSKLKTATGREIVSVRPASAAQRRKADAAAGTDSGVRALGPATTIEEALKARALSLQVEFSTVSKTRAAGMAYPHGTILKRRALDLAGLDMYRCMWEDEAGRWSLAEEMRASYDY